MLSKTLKEVRKPCGCLKGRPRKEREQSEGCACLALQGGQQAWRVLSEGWEVIGENVAEHVGQEDHGENFGFYSE